MSSAETKCFRAEQTPWKNSADQAYKRFRAIRRAYLFCCNCRERTHGENIASWKFCRTAGHRSSKRIFKLARLGRREGRSGKRRGALVKTKPPWVPQNSTGEGGDDNGVRMCDYEA